jgi:hypothetical protein
MSGFLFWRWISVGLPSVFAGAVVGLVSVWAVISRLHWFVRVAVLGGVISLMLLSPRYPHEYALTHFIQAVGVIAGVIFYRRRMRRADPKPSVPDTERPRCQFSLADVLLMIAVFAVLLAFWTRMPSRVWDAWFGLVLVGCFLAAVTLIVCQCAVDPYGDDARRRRGKPPVSGWPRKLVLISPWIVGAMTLIYAPKVTVYYAAINPRPLPEEPLPVPNGYEDLIRAAMPLAVAPLPQDPDSLPTAQLQALITTHQPSLELGRQGLARQCRVPLTYTQADLARPTDSLRELGRLFAIEGKLAEREERIDDALGSYRDLLRLGSAVSRGGLSVDSATGWGAQSMAIRRIHSLHRQLSPDTCRRWITMLQQFESEQEPIEDIAYRESLWWEHAFGVNLRMIEFTFQTLGKDLSLRSEIGEDFGRDHQARMSLLIGELALQVFRAEHGREADRLQDLVPGVLPAVPLDPFTDQPLVYRPTEDGPLLYSLGPNRRDDGGQPLQYGQGDIRLGP